MMSVKYNKYSIISKIIFVEKSQEYLKSYGLKVEEFVDYIREEVHYLHNITTDKFRIEKIAQLFTENQLDATRVEETAQNVL